MHDQPFTVTLSHPDGDSIAFLCQGAVVYGSDPSGQPFCAITGRLTLGDAAQLMAELIDSFGAEDVCLSLGLALTVRRLNEQ